ncbi:hypothetical protein AB0V79_27380 [Mesorhizobium ciceri]|uniref:hypothetical protein n=1 Tax=Mesorhizobium ciceri TaxID=39645 RepID=UPI000A7E8EBA|nr:hypothetical protein [Mesorhizobium ciceri]
MALMLLAPATAIDNGTSDTPSSQPDFLFSFIRVGQAHPLINIRRRKREPFEKVSLARTINLRKPRTIVPGYPSYLLFISKVLFRNCLAHCQEINFTEKLISLRQETTSSPYGLHCVAPITDRNI